MTGADLADVATTPAALLARVRTARTVADDAEATILELAVEWASAHPVLDGDDAWRIDRPRRLGEPMNWAPGELDASVKDADDESIEWCGIPPVRADAPASFAAANQMATPTGKTLIRDALVLAHRLPRLWARVTARQVPAWRARRVAQAVLGSPPDVVAYIDAHVSPVADKIGPITLDRLVDEAMLRLHAEEREIERLEELDARYVNLNAATINHTGIAELVVRGDWKDLHDFEATVSLIAAALEAQGCTETLDVRRAMAVGILADPRAAQALLDHEPAGPSVRKQIVLHLHLSYAALTNHDTVARNETTGEAMLAEQVREWCSRTDTHLIVKPVLDLTDHVQTSAYEIPDRLAEQVRHRDATCVFPWCTRPARTCDVDHVVPYARGGPTSSSNLAPLCRTHHRLKTPHDGHPVWTYRPLDPVIDPGAYLWTDPHGLQYLRRATGTVAVTSSS